MHPVLVPSVDRNDNEATTPCPGKYINNPYPARQFLPDLKLVFNRVPIRSTAGSNADNFVAIDSPNEDAQNTELALIG